MLEKVSNNDYTWGISRKLEIVEAVEIIPQDVMTANQEGSREVLNEEELDENKSKEHQEPNTLPIIIATGLSAEQEGALLDVLKRYKKAIEWTITDIKGINPTSCQHKIKLEEGKKLVVDAQRC
ncbi:Retrovirus-related Pol polyprotein from transposon opus [Gossypium australe]|uniref:Retrovirus-related Pol polyprotein from transposon opus n=1 Tax=Gossypium australe TaxID=47621 RepID=A0A5B6WMQ1_9ROSI|nr:Retrovirus-related Pol polyprotein from transposon opus [Gossypium australe]